MYGLLPQQQVRGKKGKGQTPPPVADTIPALMAPGEAALPPDTVQALGGPPGVQALIDATHDPVTPVVDPRQRVAGQKPQLFFANGGVTPDREELINSIPKEDERKAPAGNYAPQPSEFVRNFNNTMNALGGLSAPIQAPARAISAVKALNKAEDGVRLGLQAPGQLAAPTAAKALPGPATAAAAKAPQAAGGSTPLLSAPAARESADFVVDAAGQAVRGNPQVPAVQAGLRGADEGADWLAGMGSSAQASRPVTGQMPTKNMGPVQEVGAPMLPAPAQATQAAQAGQQAATGARNGVHLPMADVAQANAVRAGQAAGIINTNDRSGPHPAAGQAGQEQPQAPADARSMYFQDRSQDMRERWNRGDYAGAVGSGVRTAGEGLGILAIGAADNIISPWVDAAGRAWDGLAGNQPGEAQAATPPATQGAAPAAKGEAPAKSDSATAAGAAKADAGKEPADEEQAPRATRVANGVYRSGNAYSDTAAGAYGLSQDTRTPSAQNQAAAQALADRSQRESMARVQAAYGLQERPRRGWSVAAPPSSAALDQQTKNLLSKVLTPYVGAQNGQLTAAQLNAARGILEGAQERGLKGYQAQLQAQTQLQHADLQNDGAMAREQLSQSGANFRDANRTAVDMRRLGLDGQRLYGDQLEQGARLYEAERVSGILDELGNPDTPKERADFLQQQLQLLRGKQDQNRFTVVPGGQEWDDRAGSMRTVPARVLNNQTGQFLDAAQQAAPQPGAPAGQGPAQPKSKAEYDALPKGAQYIKNGIVYTKG